MSRVETQERERRREGYGRNNGKTWPLNRRAVQREINTSSCKNWQSRRNRPSFSDNNRGCKIDQLWPWTSAIGRVCSADWVMVRRTASPWIATVGEPQNNWAIYFCIWTHILAAHTEARDVIFLGGGGVGGITVHRKKNLLFSQHIFAACVYVCVSRMKAKPKIQKSRNKSSDTRVLDEDAMHKKNKNKRATKQPWLIGVTRYCRTDYKHGNTSVDESCMFGHKCKLSSSMSPKFNKSSSFEFFVLLPRAESSAAIFHTRSRPSTVSIYQTHLSWMWVKWEVHVYTEMKKKTLEGFSGVADSALCSHAVAISKLGEGKWSHTNALWHTVQTTA